MSEIFNPLLETEKIHKEYFNFFLTSFSPNNEKLQKKLEVLKDRKYLWREPYIAISKRYELGSPFETFESTRISKKVKDGFRNIKFLYMHQETGIRNILNNRNTIVSTGTGSGKTEIFLIPILDYCYKNRDKPGVKAILVYPMNALANDQVERLRKALWYINKGLDKKITFAVYTGETPESIKELKETFEGLEENHIIMAEEEEIANAEKQKIGCDPSCDKLTYDTDKLQLKCRCGNIRIDYQLLTREQIRNTPPDILITNYVQLEHLLLRKKDENIFSNGQVKFIVFDEIHAYSGARGIDVALLNRRLLSRLRKYENPEPVYIGTSATISTLDDETERKEEIAKFAERMFGVEFSREDVVEGKEIEFEFEEPYTINFVKEIPHTNIKKLDVLDFDSFFEMCKSIYPKISEATVKTWKKEEWSLKLGELLIKNPFFQLLVNILKEPSDFDEIFKKLENEPLYIETMKSINNNRHKMKSIIWSYLKTASLASHPKLSRENNKVPLIRVSIHNFFRTIDRIYKCNNCGVIYIQPKNKCDVCGNSVDELGVCRFCGSEFLISSVTIDDFRKLHQSKAGGKNSEEYMIQSILGTDIDLGNRTRLRKLEYAEEFAGSSIPLWQSFKKGNGSITAKKCIKCGSILDKKDTKCVFCGSTLLKEIYLYIKSDLQTNYSGDKISKNTQPLHCPFCNNSYGSFSALSPVSMSSNTAAVTLFDMIYSSLPEKARKLLIFTDNRQAASYLAGYLEDGHLTHALRSLIYQKILKNKKQIRFMDLRENILDEINDWFAGKLKAFKRQELDRRIHLELTTQTGRQRSIENLGMIEVTYAGLESLEKFKDKLKNLISDTEKLPISLSNDYEIDKFRKYLIVLANIIRTDGALEGLHTGYGRDLVVGYINEEKTKKIPESYPRIKLKGFLSTHHSSKLFQLTRDTFKINNKQEIKEILKLGFRILRKLNILVHYTLRKWKTTAKGYIVGRNQIILRIPEIVFVCDKCKRVYANLPEGVCATYRCNGNPRPVKYTEFLEETNNYYIKLYQKAVPIKMITAEDTGTLKPRDRRPIETEFKKREFKGRAVDVIVATPTLELGVDIGDLVSIGLFKAPPSPASYLQRAGRAGRKEKISFNNTFLFLTPIDKYYFKFPQKLIKGIVNTPAINLENSHLLQKHINSLILEELFIHSENADMYESAGAYRMYTFVAENYIDLLIKDLRASKNQIMERISLALHDLHFEWITDRLISQMIDEFEKMVKLSVNRYKTKLDGYERIRKELYDILFNKRNLTKSERDDISRRISEISEEFDTLKNRTTVVTFLMDTNVLPRYAFPGIFVEINDAYGFEEFGGRARNYAITEYAPNMEIYLRKAIYKSIGIDFEFIRPVTKDLYVCPNCSKYITEDVSVLQNGCPICGHRLTNKEFDNIRSVQAIEPNIIFIRKTNKPLHEPRNYQEAVTNIYFSERPESKIEKVLEMDPNIKITRYGNISLSIVVSGVNINGEIYPIELCEKCGKVKEITENTNRKHIKLGSHRKEWCDGRYRKFSLFHKMPTNVISIKFDNTSIFGIHKNDLLKEWHSYKPLASEGKLWHIFLVTFKNAIINAAQRLLQTEDGEIEGEVKDNEIILYDNVDGGVGYVDNIANRFDEVLLKAAEIVLDPDDKCDTGCLDCLWSYRRKRDITNIDKRFVKRIFEVVSKKIKSRQKEKAKKQQIGYIGKIRTIHSPPYSFEGILELKKFLKNAKEEIILTSLYVTDTPIPWPDEKEKSWAEILKEIKDTTPTIKITIIVRKPTIENHKKTLKKLKEKGIKVKIFKKEVENKLPSIVHSKLIVIDPHILSARCAIHTSANFSPEMWKNHETFDIGFDEKWVKGTYREIKKLAKMSEEFTG